MTFRSFTIFINSARVVITRISCCVLDTPRDVMVTFAQVVQAVFLFEGVSMVITGPLLMVYPSLVMSLYEAVEKQGDSCGAIQAVECLTCHLLKMQPHNDGGYLVLLHFVDCRWCLEFTRWCFSLSVLSVMHCQVDNLFVLDPLVWRVGVVDGLGGGAQVGPTGRA
jgi:hypothetical protein